MGLFSLFVWQSWLLLSLRQKQILLTSMVVCMDIMDMPDTHTPMVTMDTMESVKLKQSPKLIPFIYTGLYGHHGYAGYPYTYGHYGYYGKREAEAKSEADPLYLHG